VNIVIVYKSVSIKIYLILQCLLLDQRLCYLLYTLFRMIYIYIVLMNGCWLL